MDSTKTIFDKLTPWLKARRFWLIFLVAGICLAVLDVAVRSYIKRPNLIIRNEGHAPMAVPYFLERMKIDDSFSIAWCGSSLLQGINCTTDQTTAPHLIQKFLRKRGYDAVSYNLSHAGNVVADNFALNHAALKNNADMVVFEIVFGLFIGRGVGFQNAKPEFVYYCRDLPDFANARSNLLRMSTSTWVREFPQLWIKNHWALLNNRSLLQYRAFGGPEDPITHLGDQIMLDAGMNVIRHGHSVYEDLPKLRNTRDYWKTMDAETANGIASHMKDKSKRLNLSITDSKMRMIARSCAEARARKKPILFYFGPLNREMLDEYDMMNWKRYDRYRNTVRQALELPGCDILDLTDSVESTYFTDTQHLNMNGHRKLAYALSKTVVEMIDAAKGGQ